MSRLDPAPDGRIIGPLLLACLGLVVTATLIAWACILISPATLKIVFWIIVAMLAITGVRIIRMGLKEIRKDE